MTGVAVVFATGKNRQSEHVERQKPYTFLYYPNIHILKIFNFNSRKCKFRVPRVPKEPLKYKASFGTRHGGWQNGERIEHRESDFEIPENLAGMLCVEGAWRYVRNCGNPRHHRLHWR